MTALNSFTDQNFPGIRSLYIIEQTLITVSPPDRSNNVSIQLASGYDWEQLYFTKQTAQLKVKQRDKNGAVFFNNEIEFAVPKLRAETIAFIKQRTNKPFVAKIIDQNAKTFIVGNSTDALWLQNSFSNTKDNNYFEMVLSGDTLHPPYFLL